MYNHYFGFVEAPFSIAPDPRYLYLSDQHREALAHLLYGIGDQGGFILLTGEVGTGKTTVCRCLLQQLPDHVDVAIVVNPKLSAHELLQTICEELGVAVFGDDKPSDKQLIDALNAHLLKTHARGRNTILIVDEAQNLSAEVLEQLRLLTNLETNERKLLQLILLGQPELNDLLARPDLRQLEQRVTARYHLRPLSPAEVAGYINHRLAIAGQRGQLFAAAAVREIAKLSRGIPRVINLLCDRALLGVYAGNGQQVDRAMVRRAAREVLPQRQWQSDVRWPMLAVFLLLLALGFALRQMGGETPGGAPASAKAEADWQSWLNTAGDRRLALVQLAKLWGVEAPVDCPARLQRKVSCVELRRISVDQLQRYNRPAVLLLGEGGRAVILSALDEQQATLLLDGAPVRVAIDELKREWRGDALLLTPIPADTLPLQPGADNAGVSWLADRLARLDGSEPPRWQREALTLGTDSGDDGALGKQAWLTRHFLILQPRPPQTRFDAALQQRVQRFQQEQGLQASGVVDLDTALVLSRLTDHGLPQLRAEVVQRGS
jgi:general secretion pathway protein A